MRGTLATLLLLAALAPPALAAGPAIDPALQALLDRVPTTAGRASATLRTFSATATATPSSRLDLFLETSGGLLSPEPGLELYPLGEGRYGARADLETVRRLLAEGKLASARLSRPVHPDLDRSAPYLGLPRVRRAEPDGTFRGATGNGVLVGTVDSGVDWHHPDFQRADGTTRVALYWDQLGAGASSPVGFPFGAEYTDRLIDRGIAGGPDRTGHGTHVLGIIAGNGRGSGFRYVGMAPEATVVAVRMDFTEFGVVLGARYFFDRAEALGLPAVLNLSLGNHFGPHVGTTPFERSIDALVAPGRLIVAAAGNDGTAPVHAEMHVEPDAPQDLQFEMPSYDRGPESIVFASFEAWFDAADRYRFTVSDPQGTVLGTFTPGTRNQAWTSARGIALGWYVDDLGKSTLFVEIQDNLDSNRYITGTWRIRAERVEAGGSGEIDAWIVGYGTFRDRAAPRFTSHLDRGETILSPGTAAHVLAVGAVATRACWLDAVGDSVCYAAAPVLGAPAYFSSIGPRPDGVAKPEVLAPGFGVVAPLSSGMREDYLTPEQRTLLTTPDGLYWVSQGTSMAAPHVAGAAALLLGRFPHLTVDQLVSRIAGRGKRIVDGRTGGEARVLDVDDALAPAVDMSLAEAVQEAGGVRVRWVVGKERSPVTFRVYRGFEDGGSYTQLVPRRVEETAAFEAWDPHAEPGRTQFYRISTLDPFGLEEDLDTLQVSVPGAPALTFRAPDPNPVRDRLNLRMYFPPSSAGGGYALEVLDIQGRRVAAPESGRFASAGEEHVAHWDLRDARGRRVGAGIYLVRLAVRFTGGASRETVRRVAVLP
jgi:subtilisin family serine protease